MENKKVNTEIEEMVSDSVLGSPLRFEVKGRSFYIPPKTLGKFILINRLRIQLGIDGENVKISPIAETLRVVEKNRELVARIIAYATAKNKHEVFDETFVRRRARYFSENIGIDDLATLLLYILDDSGLDKMREYLGINEEKKRKQKVISCKKSENSYQFGGQSIFGTLLDFACQKYNWTLDYVVWGVSYNNLILLYEDSMDSIYLTDEEKKHCRVPAKRDDKVNASTDKEAAWAFINSQTWE